jgi:hypothetical protein
MDNDVHALLFDVNVRELIRRQLYSKLNVLTPGERALHELSDFESCCFCTYGDSLSAQQMNAQQDGEGYRQNQRSDSL